jgi:hypothetical protein
MNTKIDGIDNKKILSCFKEVLKRLKWENGIFMEFLENQNLII